jgi:hypothetical protein
MKVEDLKLKDSSAVKLHDAGEHYTAISISTPMPFSMFKNHIDNYRDIAKNVLDSLSKNYTRVGIDSIMGALVIELVGNEYYGKHIGEHGQDPEEETFSLKNIKEAIEKFKTETGVNADSIVKILQSSKYESVI